MKEKLKKILVERELSQVELQRLTAKRFPPKGVSMSEIRQIFCGTKTGAHCHWQIALALGLPPDYFLKNGKKDKR